MRNEGFQNGTLTGHIWSQRNGGKQRVTCLMELWKWVKNSWERVVNSQISKLCCYKIYLICQPTSTTSSFTLTRNFSETTHGKNQTDENRR